jgi:hypothetical protein
MADVSPTELLRRYQPVVRFDSHEAFFAHDVRAMADNPNFILTRSDAVADRPGYILAAHAAAHPRLTLDFLTLSQGRYPGGAEYQPGDHFGLSFIEPGSFVDKAGEYRAIERDLDPGARNRVFGRAAPGREPGSLWLQYWFFYIYNDAQFGGRVDLHEGDWEMVQIELDGGSESPVRAVYAQHAYSEAKPWGEVERDERGRPIVYSARGSHASYFEAGLHRTHFKLGDDYLPLWWDVADGHGPPVEQELVALEPAPGWVSWKGLWGGTRPRVPLLDGESPGGPVTHAQWTDPDHLLDIQTTHEKGMPDLAPAVSVRRSMPGLAVRFDVRARPLDRLVITATAERDGPPITETIVLDGLERGRVVTRTPLDPDRSYRVDVSTIGAGGVPTVPPPGSQLRIGPRRALSPGRPLAAILRLLDRLWLWVGVRLARRIGRSKAAPSDGRLEA